ncbi:MAG: hypothetical protein K6T55_12365 [Syntrophobacterales bacterium]|nr:hypothetical protein [Syntrophobacterales bacterium]
MSKPKNLHHHTQKGLKNRERFKLMWRTRAFKRFCQENRERVREELDARLREYAQKPEAERERHEQAWLDMSPEKALDEALKAAFAGSWQGEQVMAALGIAEAQKRAISCDPNLEAGKYLYLRIDLTMPKERIRVEFERCLAEFYPLVERPPIPPRGQAIMEPDEQDMMFKAYDLVEQRGVLQATWELFPETKGRYPHNDLATDARRQQVIRWHAKVNRSIADL